MRGEKASEELVEIPGLFCTRGDSKEWGVDCNKDAEEGESAGGETVLARSGIGSMLRRKGSGAIDDLEDAIGWRMTSECSESSERRLEEGRGEMGCCAERESSNEGEGNSWVISLKNGAEMGRSDIGEDESESGKILAIELLSLVWTLSI